MAEKNLQIRVPDELKDSLVELAERDGRSLTNYVTRALLHHVKRTAPDAAATAPGA